MRPWLKLLLVLLGLIVLALVAFVLFVATRWERDTTPLNDLTQMPLASLTDGVEGPPIIVFQDSREGWYVVDDPTALPPDTTIGIFGRRLLGQLFNADAAAVFCDRGRALLVSTGIDFTTQISYCDPRRVDIRPLLPFASSVQLVETEIPATQFLAEVARIEETAHLQMLSRPANAPVLTHEMAIETRFGWAMDKIELTQETVRSHVMAIAQTIDPRITVRINRLGNEHSIVRDSQGQVIATGQVMRVDDGFAVADGLAMVAFDLVLTCPGPDSCAAVVEHPDLDIDAFFEAHRDPEVLANLTFVPTSDSYSGDMRNFPTVEDLLGDLTQTGEITESSVYITYFERP